MALIQGSYRQAVGSRALAAALQRKLAGEVLFVSFSRGRDSTDASIYQIEPIGVAVPRTSDDVLRVMEVAARHDLPLLPRGGGTSQCGQTVGGMTGNNSCGAGSLCYGAMRDNVGAMAAVQYVLAAIPGANRRGPHLQLLRHGGRLWLYGRDPRGIPRHG